MSDNISNPHDKFFRETWSRREVVEDFIDHYLPIGISQHLDKTTLTIEKDTFVDKDLSDHYSDILYSLTLKNGKPCQLYLLFDHKSYVDKWARFQLLRYMLNNWEQQRKAKKQQQTLAPIIPILFYHGKQKWRFDTHFVDLLGDVPNEMKAYLPDFQHVMCDLSGISDDEIKGRVMIQIATRLFKHIFDDDFEKKLPDILALFQTLKGKKTGLEYLHTTLRYLGSTTDIDDPVLTQILQQKLSISGNDIMKTLADKWMEKGKQKGIEKGMQEGIQEGIQKGRKQGIQEGKQEAERKIVMNLLTLKFNNIDESTIKKVETAPSEQLIQWSERILFATTIDEIFK